MMMKKNRFFSSAAFRGFGAGALATLALPPFFIWPIWFVSAAYLYMSVLRADNKKSAFFVGFWWGFGYFVLGLYWIVNSLLVDAANFGWMIPFALTLLPASMAVYFGLAALVFRLFNLSGIYGAAMFSALISASEWLRGHLFTGFPWNLPSYVLNASDATIQLASVIGAYGCVLPVMFAGMLPATAILEKRKLPAFIIVAIMIFAYGWGSWRLNQHPTEYVDGLVIRLVQGNIDQKLKWREGEREKGVIKHIGLSGRDPLDGVSAVIWSESAVPFIMEPESKLTDLLAEAVPPDGVLITGADREDNGWYNSLFVLSSGGRIENHYDKLHLVPFGEYVPLRKYLPIISMVYGGGDFKTGDGSKIIQIPGLPPARPLICYEAIFPDEVKGEGFDKAGWLLNITNDAWFGDSTGPRQHLEMARMRAVENGLPLVRVANTGISAMFDAYGRELYRSEIDVDAVVDLKLPLPAHKN